jgi:hypothetical protein
MLKTSVFFKRENAHVRRNKCVSFRRECVFDVNLTVTGSDSCLLPKFHVGLEKQPFHETSD